MTRSLALSAAAGKGGISGISLASAGADALLLICGVLTTEEAALLAEDCVSRKFFSLLRRSMLFLDSRLAKPSVISFGVDGDETLLLCLRCCGGV